MSTSSLAFTAPTPTGLPIVDWAMVEGRLAQGVTQGPGTGGPDRHTSWLATINRDGGPHVTGVGALWHEGAFWFETGEQARKGRNRLATHAAH